MNGTVHYYPLSVLGSWVERDTGDDSQTGSNYTGFSFRWITRHSSSTKETTLPNDPCLLFGDLQVATYAGTEYFEGRSGENLGLCLRRCFSSTGHAIELGHQTHVLEKRCTAIFLFIFRTFPSWPDALGCNFRITKSTSLVGCRAMRISICRDGLNTQEYQSYCQLRADLRMVMGQ